MEINCIGYHHPHDKHFLIDRAGAEHSCLFLLIKTPAVFVFNGREIHTPAGTFILYAPGIYQFYRADGEEYIDDWFHFRADADDFRLFEALEIPLNTPTPLHGSAALSGIIRSLTYEFYSDEPFRTDIIDLYSKLLFFKLSQILHAQIQPEQASSVYAERLNRLRTEIRNNPQKDWTIDSIARSLSMSRSGFQHTYKSLFGNHVKQDIIDSRIRRAKYYLLTSSMTLAEIAEQCGYTNEGHFLRQFRQVCGVTPTQFRKTL